MEYLIHLAKDKKLKKAIGLQQGVKLARKKNVHIQLCGSIMSQQLSTKVADVIRRRFLALYGREPTPQQILDTSFDSLRQIGLSNAKTNYVLNVARFAIESGMEYRQLAAMDDESVIGYLTQIKGVGRWTAEMMLMFTLGREDVFAVDDLGIQQAMMRLYKLDPADKKLFRENMLAIAERWRPYRTYACIHLWRWKDKPAKSKATAAKVTA